MVQLSTGKKILLAVVLIFAVLAIAALTYFSIRYLSKPDEPEFVVPLTGTPIRIPPGGTFTLSWKVENASKVTFQNNQIDVTSINTLPYPVGSLTGPIEFTVTAVKDLPTGGQSTINSSWTGYVDVSTNPNIFFESFFSSNNYFQSYSDFEKNPQSLVLQWTTNTDVNVQSVNLVQTIEADYSGTPDIPKVLKIPLDVAVNLPSGQYPVPPIQIPNIVGIFSVLYNLEITNTDQQTVQSGNIIVQFGGPAPPPSVSLQTIPVSGSIIKGQDVQIIWYISNLSTNQQLSLAIVPVNGGGTPVWNNIYTNDSTTVSTNEGSVRVIFMIQTTTASGTSASYYNYIIQVQSLGVSKVNLYQTAAPVSYDPDGSTNYPGFCAQPVYNYQTNIAHSGGTQYGGITSTGDFLATYYAHQHVSLFACLEYTLGVDVGITDLAVTAGPSPASNSPLWPICPVGNSKENCKQFYEARPAASSNCNSPAAADVYCGSKFLTDYVSSPDVGCPAYVDAVTDQNVWTTTGLAYKDALTSRSENNLMRYILVESTGGNVNQNNWDDYYSGTSELNNSFFWNTNIEPQTSVYSAIPSFLNTKLCTESNPASSNGKLSWVMLATLPAVSSGSAQPINNSNATDSGWNPTSLLPITTSNPPGNPSNAYPVVFALGGYHVQNEQTSMMTSTVMASGNVASRWSGPSGTPNGGGILGNFVFTSTQNSPYS